jgi:hypothetical protein
VFYAKAVKGNKSSPSAAELSLAWTEAKQPSDEQIDHASGRRSKYDVAFTA